MARLKVQLPRLLDIYDGRLLRDLVRQVEDVFGRLSVDNTKAETPVAGDRTVTATDSLLLVDTSGGNVQVTLPELDAGLIAEKFEVTVKKIDPANRLRIVPTGTATIDGYTAVDVFVSNTALQFRAVSAGWVIV